MYYDALVIGGGQAGLAMGYWLKQSTLSYLIVDKQENVGDTWANRYDSLVLFTPRQYNQLPGLSFPGQQKFYPSKDDVASYLQQYARTFDLPIQNQTCVQNVSKIDGIFFVETDQGLFSCQNLIIATGPFQKPKIPEFSNSISNNIVQLHSSEYKNRTQLQDGNVLVVGGGNSGAQITSEIARESTVHLSISEGLNFLPLSVGKKSIFWWLDKIGILKATKNSCVGKFLQEREDPIFGYTLKDYIRNEIVKIHPRLIKVSQNQCFFEDKSTLFAKNIIWATGFRTDYSWINIKSAFDKNGFPIHNRGISPVKGLYFLGLPWQYRRGSSLLQGVGADANFLFEHLKKNS